MKPTTAIDAGTVRAQIVAAVNAAGGLHKVDVVGIARDLGVARDLVEEVVSGSSRRIQAEGEYSNRDIRGTGVRVLPLESARMFLEISKMNARTVSRELALAIWNGDVGRFHAIMDLRREIDVNTEASDGRLPLHAAVSSGRLEMVAAVLSRPGVRVDATSEADVTALTLAARSGNQEIVELLLKTGADVNTAPSTGIDRGESPLLAALENRHIDVATTLLSAGADVNVRGFYGTNALSLAAGSSTDPEKVAALVSTLLARGADARTANESGWTPLMVLAQVGNIPAMAALLDAGANVNAKTSTGETIWHFAQWGSRALIEFLIDRGADIHTPSCGRSPVFKAALCGNYEGVLALEAAGAKLDGRDQWGCNILNVAAGASVTHTGAKELVEYLLGKGYHIDSRDSDGETPLLDVVRRGIEENVEFLLAKGADARATDVQGRTALMAAAERWRARVIDGLVDAGAPLDARDSKGRTALMIAAQSGCRAAYDRLLARGADPTLRDSDGLRAADHLRQAA